METFASTIHQDQSMTCGRRSPRFTNVCWSVSDIGISPTTSWASVFNEYNGVLGQSAGRDAAVTNIGGSDAGVLHWPISRLISTYFLGVIIPRSAILHPTTLKVISEQRGTQPCFRLNSCSKLSQTWRCA